MSHNIENNQIAWKGETPWHGLGYQVEDGATGEQMLVTAGLNWDVERRRLSMNSTKGEKTQKWLVEGMKGYRAIVRADTNFVFQVATQDYHPMQNADIVNYFREFCEAGHASMETVGGLKGGRMVWALAKLNGGSNGFVNGNKEDETRGYMLMATSHDGSIRTIGMPTQVRVVCWNTLSAAVGKYLTTRGEKARVSAKQAKAEGVFLMKHSRKWTAEVAKEAKETMGLAIEQIQEANELATTLSKIAIDNDGRLEFAVRLFTPEQELQEALKLKPLKLIPALMKLQDVKEPEKVLGRIGQGVLEAMVDSPGSDLPTAKDTMWGALNGVTYYADHIRGKNQDQRLYGSWFGPGNTRKQRAVNILLQMAGKKVPVAA